MKIKQDFLSLVRSLSHSSLAVLPVSEIGGKRIRPTSRICICCGEPMLERGNSMSRDPNVCASCSSLADGLEEEGSQPVGNDDYGWLNAGISVPIRYKR